MTNEQPQINVIGIGLDGIASLTETTRKIIASATILSGASRHLNYFADHPAVKIILKDLDLDLDQVIQRATEKEKVVIFASGDPLFFGLGRLLLAKIPANNLNFYPHISSIQLAFSKLKIPWQDAKIISVHGRDCDELIKVFKQGVNKIAILTDSINNPIAIANIYLNLEIPSSYSFHICENLTQEQGIINSFTSSEISTLVSFPPTKFAPLNILVLIKEELAQKKLDLANLPLFGIADSAFLTFSDRPNLITKKEVRSVILAELALQANQVVWDIGAGTGSVSIEIARLCPTIKVYAIEKTAIGISLIKQNCQIFAVKNIEPIAAKAPESLANLPTPNRIFLGGSGGNLIAILNTCQQKIVENGIIVIALATIEHFAEVIAWAKKNNWHYNLLQVQVSKSIAIADLTRLSPLNPVTIIKLAKTD